MQSPSARKVWIEIMERMSQRSWRSVTFREEGVDWNRKIEKTAVARVTVTFREEGVDWNIVMFASTNAQSIVTFREEGVDWNQATWTMVAQPYTSSPSARKVWIEIHSRKWRMIISLMSPSARKVWIEILPDSKTCQFIHVTFREEGVDWNAQVFTNRIHERLVTFREEGVDWNNQLHDYRILG